MKIREIIDALEKFAPLPLQESYDNAGLQIGLTETEVSGALLCLDVTEEVIREAVSLECNLVISHHPLLFRGLKTISDSTYVERCVRMAIQNEICIYAAHTNLDNLPTGVNGILAQVLEMTNCQILRPMKGLDIPEVGAGMIGDLLYPLPMDLFLEKVKAALRLPVLRTARTDKQVVSRVAICGGAGSFLIEDAIAQGADIYLTGDLKYHDFQQAEGRIAMVDVGHYESEQFSKELIYSIISKKFSNFACFISERGRSFINFI